MNVNFQKIKDYLLELDLTIIYEDEADAVIVVDKEEDGLRNLVIGVADPLLIIEQFIIEIKNPVPGVFKKLLQKNRDIIHGAFTLDETGEKVIFRNVHELENLDINELEATFNSLALLLGEYSGEIIELSQKFKRQ